MFLNKQNVPDVENVLKPAHTIRGDMVHARLGIAHR